MSTKKKPVEPQVQPPASGTVISNCHIESHCAANEHTRDAVAALAAAAQANAEAIAQIAKALQSNAPVYGIYMGGGRS
jgi:hypothetical protein